MFCLSFNFIKTGRSSFLRFIFEFCKRFIFKLLCVFNCLGICLPDVVFNFFHNSLILLYSFFRCRVNFRSALLILIQQIRTNRFELLRIFYRELLCNIRNFSFHSFKNLILAGKLGIYFVHNKGFFFYRIKILLNSGSHFHKVLQNFIVSFNFIFYVFNILNRIFKIFCGLAALVNLHLHSFYRGLNLNIFCIQIICKKFYRFRLLFKIFIEFRLTLICIAFDFFH